MHDTTRDDRRVVTVPVWMMRLTGGNAQYAVVLSQIAYWTQPNLAGERRTSRMVERRGETWMYLTDAEMGNELGMGDDQFRRARLALGRQGLIATRSSQVDGRKVTLVRLTISPIPDGDDAADARRSNPADARDPLPIEPREKPENTREPDSVLTSEAVDRAFEMFWRAYPERPGRGRGSKTAAGALWAKMSAGNRAAAMRGVSRYAEHCANGGPWPKNAETWLRNKLWLDWQADATEPDDEPEESFFDRQARREWELAQARRTS